MYADQPDDQMSLVDALDAGCTDISAEDCRGGRGMPGISILDAETRTCGQMLKIVLIRTRLCMFVFFPLLCLFTVFVYFYTLGTKGHVCWIVDHLQQVLVVNKAFTAAILSLSIFSYFTFCKIKMTH